MAFRQCDSGTAQIAYDPRRDSLNKYTKQALASDHSRAGAQMTRLTFSSACVLVRASSNNHVGRYLLTI